MTDKTIIVEKRRPRGKWVIRDPMRFVKAIPHTVIPAELMDMLREQRDGTYKPRELHDKMWR